MYITSTTFLESQIATQGSSVVFYPEIGLFCPFADKVANRIDLCADSGQFSEIWLLLRIYLSIYQLGYNCQSCGTNPMLAFALSLSRQRFGLFDET